MINADEKGEGLYNVADCKGQYVKRKQNAKRVYLVECYRHDLKRWQLVAFDDVNQCVYVKPGTQVWVGFDF